MKELFTRLRLRFNKPETQEQIVIRWADTIIINSNYKGEVDKNYFMLDWVFSVRPPTQQEVIDWHNDEARKIRDYVLNKLPPINGQLDIITNELIKYMDAVKMHLLNEGYILEPDFKSLKWQLTPIGRLVKELRGHKNYKKYREAEITALINQRKINKWLIAATILVAIVPFLVAIVFPPKIVVNVPPYQLHSHNDTILIRQLVKDEFLKIKPTQKQKTQETTPQAKLQIP